MANQIFKSWALGLVLGFLACGLLPAAHAVTIENPSPSFQELLKQFGVEARTAELRKDCNFDTEPGLSSKNCNRQGSIKKTNISVFGEDTRTLPSAKLTSEEQLKYNGIGVIYCAGVFSGTAFLIFDDVILTTAHTFAHGPELNTFYSGNECELRLPSAVSPTISIEITKIHIFPDFKNNHTSGDLAKDIAVAELKYRLPARINVRPLTMPKQEDVGTQVRVVGFHGDLSSDHLITTDKFKRKTEGLLFKVRRGMNSRIPRLYGHCADIMGGVSGSPIFTQDGRVIGIVLARSPTPGIEGCNDTNNHNLAMLIDEEVFGWMAVVLKLD